jgi:glutathione S-transferase
MTRMLLYSSPLSLFSRKVEIVLAEKGIGFERVMVPFTQARGYSPKNPVVLEVCPKGQVPVLIDGHVKLYDSTVINEYLEEKFPLPSLLPKDAAARAACRLLELEADEVLLEPIRALMFRSEPPSPDQTLRNAQQSAAEKAEDRLLNHYWLLEKAFGYEDYLCGDFSLADIATFMTIHHGLRLSAPTLDDHPRLSAWYGALAKRPAFATAMAEMVAADRELSWPVRPYQKK